MNKMNKLVLGLAAAGVLLLGIGQRDALARSVSKLYGGGLWIEAEPRNDTPDLASGSEDAYIAGDVEIEGKIVKTPPSAQTLAAGFTITADACGGLKSVSGAGTSDTTATFTAPAASNNGCCMDVNNVGTTDVILDANTAFPVTSAASLTLAANGSIRVCSDGTKWRHGAWTEY